MENFLALDTSGGYLTVVAAKNGKIYSHYLPDCAMKQSVLVMGAIDETLKQADMELSECDFFAAVVGAGSFTGIRIGISVIKGFCLAYGKPALPVTSFDVAAYNAIDEANKGKKLCLVDALHDHYYACGYENGNVAYPPAYLPEEEVLALAADGYELCACDRLPLQEKAEVKVGSPEQGLVGATLANAKAKKFGELTALYVRKSSAEINQGK
ncbi:MAG: tRNA (adenosine(37)-N6)-threonylcarbamoyltransferase complex dimerization subunit type 1 TsaB [Clostridia bacterium]|nr:tRNA (adenosine(37)-N6)-threonylcarbamoyltransferase complex dimerization subunit type 1 TsaB [Clostridia bacterium]